MPQSTFDPVVELPGHVSDLVVLAQSNQQSIHHTGRVKIPSILPVNLTFIIYDNNVTRHPDCTQQLQYIEAMVVVFISIISPCQNVSIDHPIHFRD